MEVYAEETFGPVTSIYPIDSVDEAIELANESEYGLSAAIYTSDLDAAMRFANEVESGMVHINAPTMYAEPHVPFGGVGESGFGRGRYRSRYGTDDRMEVDHDTAIMNESAP